MKVQPAPPQCHMSNVALSNILMVNPIKSRRARRLKFVGVQKLANVVNLIVNANVAITYVINGTNSARNGVVVDATVADRLPSHKM